MVENYSFSEDYDESRENTEKQLLINKYNWLYEEFKKLQDYEYEDKNWNLIKLSYRDGWESKRWSVRTISVEIKEKGGAFNDLNRFESSGTSSYFLWPLKNFVANESIQKERQKYTVKGDKAKVKRVKYSLNINERMTVDWKPFVLFQWDKHYLDASNRPHEIYSIKLDELKEILTYYNEIIVEAKKHNLCAFKKFTQQEVEKDQKDADHLLKDNGLLW